MCSLGKIRVCSSFGEGVLSRVRSQIGGERFEGHGPHQFEFKGVARLSFVGERLQGKDPRKIKGEVDYKYLDRSP